MKVTGFTFIRNAIKYDYPVVEAITSILPICHDFVVAVGNSSDNTLELIQNIDKKKIRIIETVWDDALREGGKVLAEETNKAFQAIGNDSTWCFYIQGDEVVHEKYHDAISKAMVKFESQQEVDGLLFNYLHFYGSYDFVSQNPDLYRKEIRIIRNNKDFYSYRDAQGFRKGDDKKLDVKEIPAFVYHYGSVRKPNAMQNKINDFHKLWHSDEWIKKVTKDKDYFDYELNQKFLTKFAGTYPEVMLERVKRKDWIFEANQTMPNPFTLKQRLKLFVENSLGINLSYRNYNII